MKYTITQFDRELAELAASAYHTTLTQAKGWRKYPIVLKEIMLLLSDEARIRLTDAYTANPKDFDVQQFPTWLKLYFNPLRNTLVVSFEGSRFQKTRLLRLNEWHQVIQDIKRDGHIAHQAIDADMREDLESSILAKDLIKAIAAQFIERQRMYAVCALIVIALAGLYAFFTENTELQISLLLTFVLFAILYSRHGPRVMLTGHSLGGHHAENVAMHLNMDSTTFESPGVLLAHSGYNADMKSFVTGTLVSGALRHHGRLISLAPAEEAKSTSDKTAAAKIGVGIATGDVRSTLFAVGKKAGTRLIETVSDHGMDVVRERLKREEAEVISVVDSSLEQLSRGIALDDVWSAVSKTGQKVQRKVGSKF